jgi:hypothetical protein
MPKEILQNLKNDLYLIINNMESPDPFESLITNLLAERKKMAEQYIKTNPVPEDDKIPYSINKTISYLKTEAYLKSLKKQRDTIY